MNTFNINTLEESNMIKPVPKAWSRFLYLSRNAEESNFLIFYS